MTDIDLGMIRYSGEEATAWVSNRLEKAGLRVYRSFDLRSALAADSGCVCPDHGTEACDCQMVVLLVYDGPSAPASLVLHGHDGRTWLALAEARDAALQASITDALAPTHLTTGPTS